MSQEKWNFPDSDRYSQAAENLRVHKELYARPWPQSAPRGQAVQEFTIRPLGYPLFVLGLGNGTQRPVLLLLVQNLLSLLNIGLVLRWWTWWARPSISEWSLALGIILTFPAQLIYANAVMSEALLQTVVLAMTAGSYLFIKTGSKRYLVGVAGALVAALLLKPVFYPLTIGLVGVGGLLAWRRQQISLALIGMMPLVVVVTYMEWNRQRTGYFHFSSIAEINLLHYNAAGVVRQIDGPMAEEKWVAAVLREANTQPDFASRQQLIQARAGAVLWEHPVVYARQHLQGMVTFFLDPGRFDVSEFAGLAPPKGGGLLTQTRAGGLLRAVSRLPLGLLATLSLVFLTNVARLLLAVCGLWQLKNSGPAQRYGGWIVVGLLLYVAFLTGPLGAARFLVPVWPLLLGLALVGLHWGNSIKREEGGASR
ncbi:hypothetical protein [Hymenobacter terrenus]|uniref:hypothetical protein n=1 Tax=Hymenobacter terrenus TaxID=1629124 RepID=UPI0012E0AA39|nr:hypothetical protein [Hymenobacter terrenus]